MNFFRKIKILKISKINNEKVWLGRAGMYDVKCLFTNCFFYLVLIKNFFGFKICPQGFMKNMRVGFVLSLTTKHTKKPQRARRIFGRR